MSIETAEHNRTVALRWIDAFNARDDAAEATARTTDYIAHAPADRLAPPGRGCDSPQAEDGSFADAA